MKKISRRNLIHTSLITATAAVIAPGIANSRSVKPKPSSGLVTGQPIGLPYESIAGFLSKQQLTPHHDAHYGGALRGFIKTDAELHGQNKLNGASFATTQRARTQKANSVILHELYFAGMTDKPSLPSSRLVSVIKKRFGSLQSWMDDFQACAKAASGWAVLAYDQINGKLYNVISDKHADGVLWNATPLIVIDVYEHAYYVDYQNNKSTYIKKYMQHINWQVVNQRFRVVK